MKDQVHFLTKNIVFEILLSYFNGLLLLLIHQKFALSGTEYNITTTIFELFLICQSYIYIQKNFLDQRDQRPDFFLWHDAQ